jgi:hypothetical protein
MGSLFCTIFLLSEDFLPYLKVIVKVRSRHKPKSARVHRARYMLLLLSKQENVSKVGLTSVTLLRLRFYGVTFRF